MAGYADDEISEILGRALSKDDEVKLSHSELEEIAAEVGISRAQLERAAAEVRAERARRSDLEEAELAVAVQKRRRRRRWLRHLFAFGVVTSGLALLDAINPPMTWWFYPAIAWGMAVAMSGSRLLFADDDAELARQLRRIEKKRARARRAAERRAGRRRKPGLSDAESAFEAAVERGIALLLTKVADKIEAATERAAPADTDFGRFVARKEGVAARVERAHSAGVRVADEDAAMEDATAQAEGGGVRHPREAER